MWLCGIILNKNNLVCDFETFLISYNCFFFFVWVIIASLSASCYECFKMMLGSTLRTKIFKFCLKCKIKSFISTTPKVCLKYAKIKISVMRKLWRDEDMDRGDNHNNNKFGNNNKNNLFLIKIIIWRDIERVKTLKLCL